VSGVRRAVCGGKFRGDFISVLIYLPIPNSQSSVAASARTQRSAAQARRALIFSARTTESGRVERRDTTIVVVSNGILAARDS
jgi:hypothetical protein